jgi:hypothetical protein
VEVREVLDFTEQGEQGRISSILPGGSRPLWGLRIGGSAMIRDNIRKSAGVLLIVSGVCAAGTLSLWAPLGAVTGGEGASAKVIEVIGNVEVRGPGEAPGPAAPGDFIYEGWELTVPSGGEATLAMHDKTLREFTGPSTITISRDRVEAGTVLGNLTAAVADMLFSSNLQTSQAVMATRSIGDASGGASLPMLLQPAHGENLIAMPREFKWLGIRGVPLYRITLYSASEMMWQDTTQDPEVRWPVKDCNFEPGQTYYWVVEALVGNTTLRSSAGEFTLLDKNRTLELTQALDDAAASVSDGDRSLALRARLCLDTRAYSKALEVLNAAIETTPSREAFALRAEVNRALGLTEEALSDYRKAITLETTD